MSQDLKNAQEVRGRRGRKHEHRDKSKLGLLELRREAGVRRSVRRREQEGEVRPSQGAGDLPLSDGSHLLAGGCSSCDPQRQPAPGERPPVSEERPRLHGETNHATYRPSLKSNCRHMCKGQGNLFCQLCALLLGD